MVQRAEYRVIRKEYDDGSILEFWFPGKSNGKGREIVVIKDPKGDSVIHSEGFTLPFQVIVG